MKNHSEYPRQYIEGIPEEVGFIVHHRSLKAAVLTFKDAVDNGLVRIVDQVGRVRIVIQPADLKCMVVYDRQNIGAVEKTEEYAD